MCFCIFLLREGTGNANIYAKGPICSNDLADSMMSFFLESISAKIEMRSIF